MVLMARDLAFRMPKPKSARKTIVPHSQEDEEERR
jgi:hypothetical protein